MVTLINLYLYGVSLGLAVDCRGDSYPLKVGLFRYHADCQIKNIFNKQPFRTEINFA